MTTKQTEILITQWGTDPRPPVHRHPWERRNDGSAEERATRAALKNRPDLGWAFAERIAGSLHPCPILKHPGYRWVRAAKNLPTGGATAAKHLRDVEVVEQARELRDSDEIRPVLNALLMTRGATALSVADAAKIRPVDVIEAYSPDALELTANGAFSNSTTIKLADPELRDKSLRRHVDTFTAATQSGASNTLLQDLADDPVPKRMEAVLHSQFLVMGTNGPSMKSLVEN